MTKILNYPRADKKTQWFQNRYPGSLMNLKPRNLVVVFHTTEGMTWPGYDGGATAPTYTGLPPLLRYKDKGQRSGKWRAHFPENRSSRALRNKAGGVETNTQNTIQIELVGTCDPANRYYWGGNKRYKAGRDYVYWPDATPRQKQWVARLLADIHRRWGLHLRLPKPFRAYPGSYGEKNPNRMTFQEWNRSFGVIGHQHIPENSHGDPGNIDMVDIINRAKKLVKK